jgi:ribonuclease HII
MLNVSTKFDVGIDDSGRGALGGAQVLSAVYAPEPVRLQWLGATDSKNTDACQRRLFIGKLLKLPGAVTASSAADAAWINQVGVDTAEALSVRSLVDDVVTRLGTDYHGLRLLVDGRKHYPNLPREIEVVYLPRGDRYIPQISAASMLAAHEVDALLDRLQQAAPDWPVARGRAYAGPEHLAMLYDHGPQPWHYQKACRTAVTHYALKKRLPLPAWLRGPWKEAS